MKLLPEELKADLPGIGSNPEVSLRETRVHIKFHDPSNRWKWYVLEYDGEDTFFGLVVSAAAAVAGQFTLTELEHLSPTGGQSDGRYIRRDLNFLPTTVGELMETEPGIGEILPEQHPLIILKLPEDE